MAELRSHWPQSTYRLQFHAHFTFQNAAAISEYLGQLGISHAYASPYLKAEPGSMHGYDVVDHTQLNPELGTRVDFDVWIAALSDAGLSHIVDIVPNHIGVAAHTNTWWQDVLEHGPASRYADYFDITWNASSRPQQQNKLLLPLLGDLYGKVLEKGELKLSRRDGALFLNYYEKQFPLDPRTYAAVLNVVTDEAREKFRALIALSESLPDRSATDDDSKRRRLDGTQQLKADLAAVFSDPAAAHALDQALARINGQPGNPSSMDTLDAILSDQCYRLAYWRNASDEINYRRFFDVNDLAAIRMENPAVFQAVHQLIFELLREGKLTGLRVDHPDGLRDPKTYFENLQRAWHEQIGAPADQKLYVVAEKILAAHESLRHDWPVAGTSGYDFLNFVTGLYVDGHSRDAMTAAYQQFTGDDRSFAEHAYHGKKWILKHALASELTMLAYRLDELAQRDRLARDLTLRDLTAALRETIASFPVYRTYMTDHPTPEGRSVIDAAISAARARAAFVSPEVFDFLRRTLLLEFPRTASDADRDAQRTFVAKFEQLTAPATAKGVEDTAFYRYHRLTALNEVGGDPDRFGVSPDQLHAYFSDRAAHWPYALSCLSTHDTKRSEDVRARLLVLSEIPDRWAQAVTRWQTLTEPLRPQVADRPAPTAGDCYLLYQTLIGAWPHEPLNAETLKDFIRRIQAYMQKALREAKQNTLWTQPNTDYENAVSLFVERLIHPDPGEAFQREFLPLQQYVSHIGMLNSLSQTLLRLTAPGVPDTYQGTELWDLSLVDPDNRRPVNYPKRQSLLRDLHQQMKENTGGDRASWLKSLFDHLADGRCKMLLTQCALHARKHHPGLFTRGAYIPLRVAGKHAHHLFAFAREHEGKTAIILAPRLLAAMTPKAGDLPIGRIWEDTAVDLPHDLAGAKISDVLTGKTYVLKNTLLLRDVFTVASFALIVG